MGGSATSWMPAGPTNSTMTLRNRFDTSNLDGGSSGPPQLVRQHWRKHTPSRSSQGYASGLSGTMSDTMRTHALQSTVYVECGTCSPAACLACSTCACKLVQSIVVACTVSPVRLDVRDRKHARATPGPDKVLRCIVAWPRYPQVQPTRPQIGRARMHQATRRVATARDRLLRQESTV